jgi:hypothetical protein
MLDILLHGPMATVLSSKLKYAWHADFGSRPRWNSFLSQFALRPLPGLCSSHLVLISSHLISRSHIVMAPSDSNFIRPSFPGFPAPSSAHPYPYSLPTFPPSSVRPPDPLSPTSSSLTGFHGQMGASATEGDGNSFITGTAASRASPGTERAEHGGNIDDGSHGSYENQISRGISAYTTAGMLPQEGYCSVLCCNVLRDGLFIII